MALAGVVELYCVNVAGLYGPGFSGWSALTKAYGPAGDAEPDGWAERAAACAGAGPAAVTAVTTATSASPAVTPLVRLEMTDRRPWWIRNMELTSRSTRAAFPPS